MKFESAKQLKDAGFPQMGGDGFDDKGRYCNSAGDCNFYCYDPTLSELIEACGDKFEMLRKSPGNGFDAYPTYIPNAVKAIPFRGETPEEAVKDLWLELNKKP